MHYPASVEIYVFKIVYVRAICSLLVVLGYGGDCQFSLGEEKCSSI